jgi:Concanavalin A-like lectin/glucanases superfamily
MDQNMNANRNLLFRACATGLAIGAALLTLQQSVSAATLAHRYSFNSDTVSGTTNDNGDGTFTLFVTNVTDVVGGSAWNGTLPNGGIFATNTTFASGEVDLYQAASQDVEFPPGILSNYTAITIEMWASLPARDQNGGGFLFAFGNTVDGNGGRCIFMQPGDARICLAGGQPTWGSEENASFPGFVGTSNFHVTFVIDPPHKRMLAFTNGSLAGATFGLAQPLSVVSNVFSYIGKSLFSADGYRNVDVNEFRIWDGALTGLEVAGCQTAGPDAIGSGASVGTITNVMASATVTNLPQGGRTILEVQGQASAFPSLIFLENSQCTFSSANTNILAVDTNGTVTALRPGASSIIVQSGSGSNSVAFTVFQPETVLKHRYSFNGDLHDSIGGTNWDGTADNGCDLVTIPGQAVLDSGASQFIQFPSGIITNYVALTVDMWFNCPTFFDGNCFLWTFGLTTNAAGAYYVFAQPSQARVAMSKSNPGWSSPGEQQVDLPGNWTGMSDTFHLTSVINPAAGWMILYTNGIPAGTNSGLTYQMSTIVDANNYIARSLYDADAYISVNVDEYRVYDGPLTAEEVAQAHALGPDALPVAPPTLSVYAAGGSVIVSWPTNSSGFQLKSKTAVTDASWNPAGSAVISGAKYQVTLPATNTSQFFRLSK